LQVQTGAQDPVTLTLQLSASSDDAEEEVSSGAMDLTSSDLELGVEKAPQRVGLRFPGVTVPQGAWILGASVRFTVDEVSAGASSLELRGELSPNASTYTSGSGDIGARPTTSAVVGW
ncbi:MAG: hypothetical protein GWM90_29835, partial [Gemmatimonadetes bacterium]|nr:hypothetical protein [Gemmatimonadota bacterium]NIU79469.1 hypothetical protein [Gammaproteobacteria bacterium]NIX48118.1 hypothetical protein [Gemmatimonadota bacterium]NIY12499.1 hypothetical protein [Gemmatimonadota bacterium]